MRVKTLWIHIRHQIRGNINQRSITLIKKYNLVSAISRYKRRRGAGFQHKTKAFFALLHALLLDQCFRTQIRICVKIALHAHGCNGKYHNKQHDHHPHDERHFTVHPHETERQRQQCRKYKSEYRDTICRQRSTGGGTHTCQYKSQECLMRNILYRKHLQRDKAPQQTG